MTAAMGRVAERLERVRARLAESARAAGRSPDELTLVAVGKWQPVEKLFEAHDHGVTDFGENTVQELETKAKAFAKAGRAARWHFIGRLQRNKASKLVVWKPWIHSVDSVPLAEALDRHAPPEGLDVLVQVNVGREPQKAGVEPEQVVAFARALGAFKSLRLRGLMGIPPLDEEARPYFELLARMLHELREAPEGRDVRELSMGMSHDFTTAIACGATIVRVGTAIFGERAT